MAKKPRHSTAQKSVPARKKTAHAKQSKKETFPHFRKYLKANHPAMILSEEQEDYTFRRVTHSPKSGHHTNEKIEPNPNPRDKKPMYIVKAKQRDKKKHFSKWKYSWKIKK